MAKIPDPIHSTAKMIFRAYEKVANQGHRPHLGASIIGHACERYIWMTFRHVKANVFDGRMLRLFQTGKIEEKRICENLRMIGCEVHEDDGGSQFSVSTLGGHFGGSMDAVIRGYHEAPKQWMPVEMKTHNAKSFKALCEKGLQEHKPMHYSQLTTYMGLSGMTDSGLYFATNKDTDDLYITRIKFDESEFNRLLDRATRVINASEPPMRISNDPSWYECKFCHLHSVCHGTEAPEVNCRTCAHSTPDAVEGGWKCERKIWPMATCREHRYIPILLENFAEQVDANGEQNWVKYKNKLTGSEFYNGDLSSKEIYACQDKAALGDSGVDVMRRELGAEVVG